MCFYCFRAFGHFNSSRYIQRRSKKYLLLLLLLPFRSLTVPIRYELTMYNTSFHREQNERKKKKITKQARSLIMYTVTNPISQNAQPEQLNLRQM